MGPGFSGWNEESGLKQYMGGEQGIKLVFAPELVLGVYSPPVLDLPYLHCHCCPYSWFKWGVIRIRSYKSSETDTHFHEMVPSFSHFTATIILGMKGGLEGQTRAQRQGDFTRMCSSTHINSERHLLFWVLIPIFRKLIVKS
jgi:hypothetical protein